MKHCPACNFSFPDFHLVCDFDGTELVPDRQRLALIKVPAQRSFGQRFIKSPKPLTALAILGLFFSAAFIAFQQTTSRSTRTLLAVAPRSLVLETAAINPSALSSAAPSARGTRSAQVRRSLAARSSVAKNRHEQRNEHSTLRRAEVVRRQTQPTSEKQPKVVAMLKTTWRVLKRPFSF